MTERNGSLELARLALGSVLNACVPALHCSPSISLGWRRWAGLAALGTGHKWSTDHSDQSTGKLPTNLTHLISAAATTTNNSPVNHRGAPHTRWKPAALQLTGIPSRSDGCCWACTALVWTQSRLPPSSHSQASRACRNRLDMDAPVCFQSREPASKQAKTSLLLPAGLARQQLANSMRIRIRPAHRSIS